MYKNVLRKIKKQHLLHSASLELTYQCNLDCFFCYNNRKKRGKSLQLEQYRKLLSDLREMGTLFLMLTGGEPMMHPNFFSIGKMTSTYGFVVTLRTNGSLLTKNNILRIKKEIHPYSIEISLHGATAQVHERQTRVKGSFQQLINNIQSVTKYGLRCTCVTTPTLWNQHQIDEMIYFCDNLSVPLRFQGPVGPRTNGDCEPLTIQPEEKTWDKIIAHNKKQCPAPSNQNITQSVTPEHLGICGVGTCGVDIDPFGNVQACMHLQESAGNLHEQSIREIWEDSPLFTRARKKAIEAAQRFGDTQPRQFGAPLFCLGVEENCRKNTLPCPT